MNGRKQEPAGSMNARSARSRRAVGGEIDWAGVHRQLDAVREIVEERWAPGPEETRRILKARAAALAQPPDGEATSGEHIELIEFALAYETYGIESSFVREVYPLTELTSLPCTPAFVLGIVNVRGEIVSVIDIKRFFGLPEKGLTDLNKVIVLQAGTMTFGILADEIVGVRSVAVNEIQRVLPTLTGIREDYLMGVTGERLVVLDAARLLSDRKIVVHEEVGD
jgi:purine-binding chemotaxis protein CheW